MMRHLNHKKHTQKCYDEMLENERTQWYIKIKGELKRNS
jgi:hypothetical protein